ncbi:MAG TPA: MlaD family protein, partial [Flavisolibacter sp.]|nr:MlaD family protein [Flavisolibacter sp.]
NIRFAGIDAGSVKSVEVLNDTTIEVTLLIQTKMKPFIHRNAKISIGTDGLIGNRIINIEPSKEPSPVVEEGELIPGEEGSSAEEMLKVLDKTNRDLSITVSEIEQTVRRVNRSKAIWELLDDERIPRSLRQSLTRIRSASASLDHTMMDVSVMVNDIKEGKGNLGKLVRDSSMVLAATEAIRQIQTIGPAADSLSIRIQNFVDMLGNEVTTGKGAVHVLLQDQQLAQRLDNTMKNIEQDSQSFNEVMEALKQSVFLRGYFRKLEKQKKAATVIPESDIPVNKTPSSGTKSEAKQ